MAKFIESGKKLVKDNEKERKLIHRTDFSLFSYRFSHSSVYLVRTENVGCNNFATAGNDRAFRPLNMQWKLLLRDRRSVVRTWRELMKLRKKRRCSGDFARNVLETLSVSHRLLSLRSHRAIACLIMRRPLQITILKSRNTKVDLTIQINLIMLEIII